MAQRARGYVDVPRALSGDTTGSPSRLKDKCFDRNTPERSGSHRHPPLGLMHVCVSVYVRVCVVFCAFNAVIQIQNSLYVILCLFYI